MSFAQNPLRFNTLAGSPGGCLSLG